MYKYGGKVLGPDGNIYAFPSDAEQVLKIIPGEPGEVKLIGPSFQKPHNKWQNGFVGRDGAVYAIPCDAEAVLKIVPSSESIDSLFANTPLLPPESGGSGENNSWTVNQGQT